MSTFDRNPEVQEIVRHAEMKKQQLKEEYAETKKKQLKKVLKDLDKQTRAALDPVVQKQVAAKLQKDWEKQNGSSPWPASVTPKINPGHAREKDRGHPVDHPQNGHCKGVLAFDLDSDSAFWISHTTPRVLTVDEPEKQFFYPDFAWKYAQTFICISLQDIKTASKIAKILNLQHEPQVYGCHLPQGSVPQQIPDLATIRKKYKIKKVDVWKFQRKNPFWLWNLAQGVSPAHYRADDALSWWPADATFRSKGGKVFRLIAKSGAWYGNFWIDLVGPHLGVDLRVESWRRLTKSAGLPVDDINRDHVIGDKGDFGDHDREDLKHHHHEFGDADTTNIVDEVVNVDIGHLTDNAGTPLGVEAAWHYTHDHAKWAISVDEAARGSETLDDREGLRRDWVCVADINRMASQERRGGGAICFHEKELWEGLDLIQRVTGTGKLGAI